MSSVNLFCKPTDFSTKLTSCSRSTSDKGNQILAILFNKLCLSSHTGNFELNVSDLLTLSTLNKSCMEKSKNIWKSLILIKHELSNKDETLYLNINRLPAIGLIKSYLQIEKLSYISTMATLKLCMSKIEFENVKRYHSQINKLTLIHNKVNLRVDDPSMFRIVMENCPDLLKLFIASGANIEARAPWGGHTLLMRAARLEDARCLRILIEAHADINANAGGLTPLMYAVSFSSEVGSGTKECMQVLLSAGADYAAITHPDQLTAFGLVLDSKLYIETIPLFINQIATYGRINLPYSRNDFRYDTYNNFPLDNDQLTLLMIMAGSGQEEYVRMCLGAGANINAICQFGNTALMYAAKMGYRNVVQTLIGAGADVDMRNLDQHTALGLALLQETYLQKKLEEENIELDDRIEMSEKLSQIFDIIQMLDQVDAAE